MTGTTAQHAGMTAQNEWNTHKGSTFKGKSLSNLFSGLLICGHCNGPITMGAHKSKVVNGEKVERKYVSCSRARRGIGCKHITWNYDDLEKEVLSVCKSIDFLEVIGKPNTSSIKTDDLLKQRLKNSDLIETNLNKIQKLIHAIEGGQQSSSIIDRIKSLEDENSKLTGENIILKAEEESLFIKSKEAESQREAFEEVIAQFNTLNNDQLLEVRFKLATQIRRVMKAIYLFPGGRWKPKEKLDLLNQDLSKTGITSLELEKLLDVYKEPNKSERYILVFFNNNEVLSINKQKIYHNFIEFNREDYIETSNSDLADMIEEKKMTNDDLLRPLSSEKPLV